jgi:peptidoglycan/xylan/chitin deacetylase (PgdA/CDA1 family)
VPERINGATRIINLTVHGIGVPDRDLEPGEDRTWVSQEQFELVLESVAGRSDVRIKFDDGNRSDVEIGLPSLIHRGMTAEFFVLAGRLGEHGRLGVDDIEQLKRAGMTVGSHGWAHRDWRRLQNSEISEEFIEAPARLGQLLGTTVTRVAVPFGSYDRRVLRYLRSAGVSRAFTSDGGPARPGAWLQARTSLTCDLDDEWIRAVLEDDASLSKRARRAASRTYKRVRGMI